MPTAEFNHSALDRAKAELTMFQIARVKLDDGSDLVGVFEGWRFVDYMDGEPFPAPVVDFWKDERLPAGGFVRRPA